MRASAPIPDVTVRADEQERRLGVLLLDEAGL
jgi:hypothetical protein